MMPINYKASVGNSDFRGFLASQAPGLLAYTGNDGGINSNDWMQATYGQGKVLGNNAAQVRFAQDPNGTDNLNAVRSKVGTLYKNWNSAQSRSGGNDAGAFAGGGAAYGSGTSFDPNVLAQYDTAVNTAQSALGRLPKQLDVARGNINSQYGTNLNEINSAKNQAKSSYDTSTLQNGQGFRSDKNQISDAASAGLRGLLRTLGAYGAGGSSDAMYVAPQAVANEASAQRAGAGQNYSQNAQSLDTNWNNFLSQDENSRKKLTDWKTQQLNSAESQSDTTKQDLLSKLADLVGQRAAYQGGSYNGSAQPYIDQANALSGRIDSLARINPTYNGQTPVYEAPSLGSYDVNPNATVGVENAAQASASPFLSLLLGQKDKQNGLVG